MGILVGLMTDLINAYRLSVKCFITLPWYVS